MIELLVYLAGAVVTTAISAIRAGKLAVQQHGDKVSEALQTLGDLVRSRNSFSGLEYHLEYLQTYLKGETIATDTTFFAALKAAPVILFWPIAIPLLFFFRIGKWRGSVTAKAAKLKRAVDAEVARIRKEEGWDV